MARPKVFVDIGVSVPRGGVLDLRARKRRGRRRPFVSIFIISFFFFAATSLLFIALHARAEVILTPGTCLGSWQNSADASGVPDIVDGDVSKYSSSNSAFVSNALGDIFCGNFAGDIPEGTKPTAITVNFSWAFVAKGTGPEVSVAPADLASSTSAVLDAPAESVGVESASTTEQSVTPSPAVATSTSKVQPTPASPNSAAAATPVDTPAAPDPTPTDITAPSDAPATPVSPDAPQSSLTQKIMAVLLPRIAHAEEIATTSSATSTSSPDQLSLQTAMTTYPIYEDAIVEVSYTLDGSTWHILGTVTRFDFSHSSFIIPMDEISEWKNLENMQIRVRSISSVGDAGTIYLDGMTLSIQYEKSVELAQLDQAKPGTPRALQNNAVFQKGDAEVIIVHPEKSAPSTNVIFYARYGATSTTYVAETSGHGDAPLSDYFAPPPAPGRYIMLQYLNDNETFECNGLPAQECMNDPHFLRRTDFEVTEDGAPSVVAATSTDAGNTTSTTTQP